jgi:DNA-binding PadR family transcriptional regulator
MPTHTNDPSEHLPLKPTAHAALLLLARTPTYGLDLLQQLEAVSRGELRLNAGSLYRLIGRLVDSGLVEPVEEVPTPEGVGAPRKLYGVTRLGRAVLKAEAERQAGLLEMARELDLLEESR